MSTGPRTRSGARSQPRRLSAEQLEDRSLLAVTVFLDFGTAPNDIGTRVNDLGALLGETYTPAEIDTMKSMIVSSVTQAFNAFDVTIQQTLPTGSFETIRFGANVEDVPGAVNGDFGLAAQDWGNANKSGVGWVFPREFVIPDLLLIPDHNTQVGFIGNALAYHANDQIGRLFGLSAADAFADPDLTPDKHFFTMGLQNRYFGAGEEFWGFDNSKFDPTNPEPVNFQFSPLARAKFEFADGVTAATQPSISETGAAHGSSGTAQPLPMNRLPVTGTRATVVKAAMISASGQADVYSLPALAGDKITAQIIASDLYEPSPAIFDTVVELLASDGTTVLATSDDTMVGFFSFGDFGSETIDEDSFVLNFPVTADGTYYLRVTGKSNTTGFYDLLVTNRELRWLPWQNPRYRFDVDNDSFLSPTDALLVINAINRLPQQGRPLPNPPTVDDHPPSFFDVDGDDFLSATDAVQLINGINRATGTSLALSVGGEGEGEAAGDPATADVDAALSQAAFYYALLDASSLRRRDG